MPTALVLTAQKLLSPLMLSCLSRAHPQPYPSLLSQDCITNSLVTVIHYPHHTSAQHAWTHQYWSSLLPHSPSLHPDIDLVCNWKEFMISCTVLSAHGFTSSHRAFHVPLTTPFSDITFTSGILLPSHSPDTHPSTKAIVSLDEGYSMGP